MPLKRKFVTIYLDNLDEPEVDYIEHTVEVRMIDMLTAETQGKALPGVELSDGLHTTYLSAWAALCREGKFKGGFAKFKAECIDIEQQKDTEAEPVDPTQPEVSGDSASP